MADVSILYCTFLMQACTRDFMLGPTKRVPVFQPFKTLQRKLHSPCQLANGLPDSSSHFFTAQGMAIIPTPIAPPTSPLYRNELKKLHKYLPAREVSSRSFETASCHQKSHDLRCPLDTDLSRLKFVFLHQAKADESNLLPSRMLWIPPGWL